MSEEQSEANIVSPIAAIFSICHLVACSVALARGDTPAGTATQYMIVNVVIDSLQILGACTPILALLGFPMSILSIVYLVLGWIWFGEYTGGYNIITFARAFGPNQWLEFPLGVRIMYFNFWLFIVMLCVSAAVIVLALVGLLLSGAFMGLESASEGVASVKRSVKRMTTRKEKAKPAAAAAQSPPPYSDPEAAPATVTVATTKPAAQDGDEPGDSPFILSSGSNA
ncbi:hypothetical protein BJ741DRAFT_64698 [Chytriomyces cf. hyalinus JEL632]|nr:hypothetical protein BJ741DRAFT_64698 [Chytriomyces cf. hyalinus JEL632]